MVLPPLYPLLYFNSPLEKEKEEKEEKSDLEKASVLLNLDLPELDFRLVFLHISLTSCLGTLCFFYNLTVSNRFLLIYYFLLSSNH